MVSVGGQGAGVVRDLLQTRPGDVLVVRIPVLIWVGEIAILVVVVDGRRWRS
jgi:hypothetical protein